MFKTMAEVRKANKANGYFFFSKGAMQFFNSRIESSLLKGRYFITSEQFDEESPREFTIREVKDNADIETVGDRYGTKVQAQYAVQTLWNARTPN